MGAGKGIQGSEGLVQQQHLGLHGQGAGDAHALLHAAGNLVGALVQCMIHVHQLQVVAYPLVHFAATLAAAKHLFHGQLHVLVGGEPGQQGMVLEHHRAVRSRLVHFPAVEDHPTTCCLVQAGDDVQDRGLAATRMTDEGDEFALGDLQADVLQRPERAVVRREVNGDPRDFQMFVAHVCVSFSAVPRCGPSSASVAGRASGGRAGSRSGRWRIPPP